MSCKISPHIQEWIDIVEHQTFAVCEEQELLVKHVKCCFETENIYTDEEQLEKYIGLAKYFHLSGCSHGRNLSSGCMIVLTGGIRDFRGGRICSASWEEEPERTGRLPGSRSA